MRGRLFRDPVVVADPPRCPDCGYDRAGLFHGPEGIAPCPECGGTDLDLVWPGWGRVLVKAAAPAWTACAVGVVLPMIAGILGGTAGDLTGAVVVPLVGGLGVALTIAIALVVPVEVGGNNTRSMWTHGGRPGMVRVVAVGWLAAWAGVGAIVALGWMIVRVFTETW